MKHAIVLCSGRGTNGQDLSLFADASVAQVPQLKRIVINSQRAGIERFHIVSDNADFLSALFLDDGRITSEINWVSPGESVPADSAGALVLESSFGTTGYGQIEKFLRDSLDRGEGEISLLVEENSEPLAGVDARTGLVDSYLDGARSVAGALVADGADVPAILSAPGLDAWLGREAERGRVRTFGIRRGQWYRLSDTGESVEEAERIIFSHVGKTATGWIARKINGRVSLPLSKLLIRTPLTPNMISVLINLIGMLCGPLYALGHPVLGAVFMQIATVLDRCDGEVARIKLMETKKGQWVDTISDQFTVLSFLIGVPLGYYLQTGSVVPVLLGTYNLVVFALFLGWSLYFIRKYTDSGSLVAYFEVDRHIDPGELSGLRKLLSRLRYLGRRNYYSAILVVLAVVGGSPLVLFASSFLLTTFLLHQVEDVFRMFRIGKSEEVFREETKTDL